jgi:hypothetical protein
VPDGCQDLYQVGSHQGFSAGKVIIHPLQVIHYQGDDFFAGKFIQPQIMPLFPAIIKTHLAAEIAAPGNIQAYMVGGTGPTEGSIGME